MKTYIFKIPDTINEKEIKHVTSKFISNNGYPNLIIDSAHIGIDNDFINLTETKAKQLLFLNSSARFVIYKQLAKHKKNLEAIIALSAMDGYFGCNPQKVNIQDPSYGALTGFYKGLRKEFLNVSVKIIDIKPKIFRKDLKEIIKFILTEITHNSKGIEITYNGKERFVVKIDEKEVTGEQLEIRNDDTVFITGGASGIASSVMLGLAEKYKPNLVLIGRTQLPQNIKELALLSHDEQEKLKFKIYEELKTKDKKVTPKVAEIEYNKIKRAIEIHNNVEKARELGSKVVYYSCDICDYTKLKTILSKTRSSYGPVSIIVHAAGLDHSHLIEDKSYDEFNTVL